MIVRLSDSAQTAASLPEPASTTELPMAPPPAYEATESSGITSTDSSLGTQAEAIPAKADLPYATRLTYAKDSLLASLKLVSTSSLDHAFASFARRFLPC